MLYIVQHVNAYCITVLYILQIRFHKCILKLYHELYRLFGFVVMFLIRHVTY